ncbi:nucleotidyltransferase domain-containing protein [Euzebya sp.]|uniref:nucleotidyltransferase domain-containing protein n=1 Tax=Euzebya sp. TaxID=1971409 RepID=UPI003514D939
MVTIAQARATLLDAADDGRLDELCDRIGLSVVVLFGSAARAEWASHPRDLDIAVLPRDPRSFDRIACHTAFVDLVHIDAVDLLDLSTAGVVAQARALGDGLPLYEDDAGLYARQQMRAVGMAMEIGWLVELDLELMAER